MTQTATTQQINAPGATIAPLVRVNLVNGRRYISHRSLAPLFSMESSELSDSIQRYFDSSQPVPAHLYAQDFVLDAETETLWISRAGVVFMYSRLPDDMVDWVAINGLKSYLGCPHGQGLLSCELNVCVCAQAVEL